MCKFKFRYTKKCPCQNWESSQLRNVFTLRSIAAGDLYSWTAVSNSSPAMTPDARIPFALSIYLSICFSSRARIRGYNRRLKECLMSQTSHVGAIISTGTAYKAAVGETVARTASKGGEWSRGADSGKRIVIQRRAEALARGPAPRFECKAGPNDRRSSRLRINFVPLKPGTRGREEPRVFASPAPPLPSRPACSHTWTIMSVINVEF